MHWKSKEILPLVAGAALIAGVFGTAIWSAELGAWPGPLFSEMRRLTRLEPVQVLTRTTRAFEALEASSALENDRPWQAWRLLRDEVFEPGASPTHVLLGARAAAGWGGWINVRTLLQGREWLSGVGAGEGWLLLARAEDELGNREAAAEAYRRYLSLAGTSQRGVAFARLAAVLTGLRDHSGAAEAYAGAAGEMSEIEDWIRALQLESSVAAGQRPPTDATAPLKTAGGAARARAVSAEARAWAAAGDPARAIRRLAAEERVLHGQGAIPQAAQLRLERAQLLIRNGRAPDARELLRLTAAEPNGLVDTRVTAARLLDEMGGTTGQEELARAAAYEAARKPGIAAKAMRAAIRAGAGDDWTLQWRLARLLYDERDYGPARVAFQRAAELTQDPERIAEAELYAARSLYRSGGKRKFDAIPELARIAERRAGTAAAGSALFMLGDMAGTLERARAYYRRAAAIPGSPDAREALSRAGDRSLRMKEPGVAIRAWQEYVERYPAGEATARVAYEAGRQLEKLGNDAGARAMYASAIRAEPISYYAMRSGDRTGAGALDDVLAEPRPWAGLATDPVAAARVLARLDALEGVGLTDEWNAELDLATRAFAARPAALIALAEGVRDRGYPVKGINLGWQLYETRGRTWDARLLRLVFPFPYRELVREEARRKDVDPALLAGLIRQESSFRHDARSRVGAAGLCQIMPSTGKWLAPLAGIRSFEPGLLEVPEVNVRMGAEYLEDMLKRYRGAADLALSGYNAGPSRADRWRKQLPSRDRDAFREAIPFDETRGYVKAVLRNAEVYRRLYR